MKQLILTIITALGLLTSCEEQTKVIIEGCQYIKTISYTGHSYNVNLTHKGNCNNPIHFVKDTIY